MRTLDRKLFRELSQIRTQALAIVAVVACGIAGYVAMASAWSSLDSARSRYYEQTRFADVFARLQDAPRSYARRLAEIPGVEAVEVREVEDVILDVPGMNEPAVGRITSLPRRGRPQLDDLYLRRGRWIEPGSAREVLVSEPFADAHGYQPGDTIEAVLSGKRERLEIVGIVLSPEYVYAVGPGGIFSDDERFGVFFMSEEALGAAFDAEGAFNDVALRLAEGANEQEVIAAVDRILERYGGVGAFARADQPSHRMVTDELEQLRTQAVIIPAIFLGVAAFLLHLVLGRIIAGQREIIAVLKALGYSDLTIGLHYLELVALISAAGGVVGGGLGAWLGAAMVGMYQRFFRFPTLAFELDLRVLFLGVALATLAGVLATVGSVRSVVRLPPAEAMRPPAPARYRRMLLERLGLDVRLSAATRMVIRRLERRPGKTALSSLGIAMALGILLVANSFRDSIGHLMDVVFRQEQLQDLTVTFVTPQPPRVLHELERLPGALRVEPLRTVAARLQRGQRSEDVAIQGYAAGGLLRRILDADLQAVTLPPSGLVLSRALGDKLGLAAGDDVEVAFREGERRVHTVKVTRLLDDLIGLNAYMELSALDRLMGEGPRVSGALLQIDTARETELFTHVKEVPAVAGAMLRRAAWEVFQKTSGSLQAATTAILSLFATVIAVGVVYNAARIVLAESARELASLRVLGFTIGEISRIFLGELFTLVLLALPLGWVIGVGFTAWLSTTLPPDLYRLPVMVTAASMAEGVIVVAGAAAVTGFWVRRRLDHLDLVEVLKTRE